MDYVDEIKIINLKKIGWVQNMKILNNWENISVLHTYYMYIFKRITMITTSVSLQYVSYIEEKGAFLKYQLVNQSGLCYNALLMSTWRRTGS